MSHRGTLTWLPRLGLALGLALSISACSSTDGFNFFGEREKKLSGERRPVFPNGVPGVDYSAPRAQPTNTNASLDNLPPPTASGI
ncbi:hypothetical protein ACT6QG_06005 [Xanthobacter sp. TB0136]|uniref:hypothetical protein n=1 Tax=Xanthobacter sp. TB0136 TaxID=3459177 RepID=UPI0040394002